MKNQYLINKSVYFIPSENILIPANNDTSIKLYAPVASILFILIQQRPEIISQEGLMSLVWGEKSAYVLPNTLYQNISLLRKGLKAAGLKEDIVKTIPRQGILLQPATIIEEIEAIDQTSLLEKDEVVDSANKNHPNKNIRAILEFKKIMILLFIFIIFSIFIFEKIWLSEGRKNTLFFDDYHFVTMIDACKYYGKNKDIKKHYQYILDKINHEKSSCLSDENYYLTLSEINDYWSWVKCNKENTQCEVIYYTGVKK
ncbi:MAG: winged helix-turn-helix domain-containing protein [Hafnia sp.]|uniref:winged helix-turn-helix domain-containing protein n=1 Tax=Hafnia sp. TaxID=1873498 RepID=UPI002FCAFDD4